MFTRDIDTSDLVFRLRNNNQVCMFSIIAFFALTELAYADFCELPPSKDSICVSLENYSSFQNHFEIVDEVCGSSGQQSFEPWEKIEYYICYSGAHDEGYGHLRYRNIDSNSWTNVRLITHGDEINLN